MKFVGYFSLLTVVLTFGGCLKDSNKLRDIYSDSIGTSVESFTINPSRDTTLFGKDGTRIFIGSGTFSFNDNVLPKDSIRFELQEFYSKSDILLAG